MERIDKILSNAGLMSRRDAKEAAKKHRITVNGTAVKSADEKINDDDILELDGNPVNRQKFYYIMMNKLLFKKIFCIYFLTMSIVFFMKKKFNFTISSTIYYML